MKNSSPIVYIEGNPNGVLTSTDKVKVIFDATNNKIYTCPNEHLGTNDNWEDQGAASSPLQYSAHSGYTKAQIWATGLGVIVSENSTFGELSIVVPEGVDLIAMHIVINSSSLDANNNYYLNLRYTGLRSYNTSIETLNLPVVNLGSAVVSSMSRTNPILYNTDGYVGVDVGISSFAGGQGSFLEIAIKDFLIATKQFIHLKF